MARSTPIQIGTKIGFHRAPTKTEFRNLRKAKGYTYAQAVAHFVRRGV